jgi:hypothetical protein
VIVIKDIFWLLSTASVIFAVAWNPHFMGVQEKYDKHFPTIIGYAKDLSPTSDMQAMRAVKRIR